MVKLKSHELVQKSKADLERQLEELKQDLSQIRVQKVGGNSSKLTKLATTRRNIARVLTTINANTRSQLRVFYKNKKYLPLDLRAKKTRAQRRALTVSEKKLKTAKAYRKDKARKQLKYAVKSE